MYNTTDQSTIDVIESAVAVAPAQETTTAPVDDSAAMPVAEEVQEQNVIPEVLTETAQECSKSVTPDQDPHAFKLRESTDFVVNRRENNDGTYDFIFTDRNSQWLKKSDKLVTGHPIGIGQSKSLLNVLANETHEFFTAIDSAAEEDKPQENDIVNMVQLRDVASKHESVLDLLIKSVGSITINSRYIVASKTVEHFVPDTNITVTYNVEDQKKPLRYRLFGDVSRELIFKFVQAGGKIVTEGVKLAQAKAHAAAVAEKNKPTQKDPHLSKTTTTTAREIKQSPRLSNHDSAQLNHLVQMVEALIVDNREIRAKLEQAQTLNHVLQREINNNRALYKDVLQTNADVIESNHSLAGSMLVILDVLSK